METQDYLRILRRSWRTILVTALLGVCAAIALTLVSKPVYSAKTQLFVAIQSSGTVSELQQGNTFSQARVQSYVKAATTPAVLQPAIDALGLSESPAALAERVQASADLNTVLITISAENESPVQAAALAQAVGESLIDVVDQLEQPAQGGTSPVRLSVITPATAPSVPSSPNLPINLFIGLIVGFGAGVGIAVLRSTIDTRIRGESDIRDLSSMPLLGGISFDPEASQKPLLTQTGAQSPRAESFRQIRTNLQFANVSSESKTMLVTSSLPGEGKSTTATNMAIAMAQAGQRVVLVDADLRRPTVAQYLGLEGNLGLTTALLGSTSIDDLIQPWGENEMYVMASGQIPPNPSEILGSAAMSRLIGQLEDIFDVVIIDAPPLIPVTDAAVLSQKVGGVVVVVGAGKTKKQDLEKSLESLKLVNARVLGAVLNLLPTKGPDAYAYSYYSYDSKPSTRRNEQSRSNKSFSGSHLRAARRALKNSASDQFARGRR